jgi:hypothetical protein
MHQIMDAAAYVQEHLEVIQRTVRSGLEQARLCIENCGGHLEQL